MNKCEICGEEHSGSICPECGFDTSLDAERYPALSKGISAASKKKLKTEYQKRKSEGQEPEQINDSMKEMLYYSKLELIKADDPAVLEQAARSFRMLGDYRDSERLLQICLERAAKAKKPKKKSLLPVLLMLAVICIAGGVFWVRNHSVPAVFNTKESTVVSTTEPTPAPTPAPTPMPTPTPTPTPTPSPTPVPAVTITKQPMDVSVTSSSAAVFSVTATGSKLSYQWQYSEDGKNFYNYTGTGANTEVLVLIVEGRLNGTCYRCVVSSGDFSVISSSAKLIISPMIIKQPDSTPTPTPTPVPTVTITKQPTDVLATGSTAVFTVSAAGSNLIYQWQYSKDGKNFYNCTETGAATAVLVISANSTNNGRYYRCIVTEGGYSVTSDSAKLTVSAKVTPKPTPKPVIDENQCIVGNYVEFGSYPQSAAGTDNTPIEWLVLERDGNKALLISRYALDCVQYNTENANVTWEACTMRSWLNSEFLSRAFNTNEQKIIFRANVSADKNPRYSTDPGNDTTDEIFLLSITEAEKYFTNNSAGACAPTDYAIAQGAYTSSHFKADGKAAGWWWLRSPARDSRHAARVYTGGLVDSFGNYVNDSLTAVRPALWVNLDS